VNSGIGTGIPTLPKLIEGNCVSELYGGKIRKGAETSTGGKTGKGAETSTSTVASIDVLPIREVFSITKSSKSLLKRPYICANGANEEGKFHPGDIFNIL
jgi:hypothetical protein